MTQQPWEGFWQVVYADDDEEIVSYPPLFTTVSLRRSGFSVYTGRFFVEIRTATGRRPPAGWPPTEAETIAGFRSARALGGPCTWSATRGGFEVEHVPTMAHDPRLSGRRFRSTASIEGDAARVQRVDAEGHREDEVWRRLSGPGSSPLAGAWESGGEGERWLYLVTAGHFGVMREAPGRVFPARGELSDAEVAALRQGSGANAGARVETRVSFDHWPMIATSNPGPIDCRKHETFRIIKLGPDTFEAALALDASDAAEWRRLE
jgi:hypothetical protein